MNLAKSLQVLGLQNDRGRSTVEHAVALSNFRKIRFSLGHESPKRFLGSGGLQHAPETGNFHIHTVQHRLGLHAFHEALGFDHRRQGLGRQLASLGLYISVDLGGRQHAIDQAHLQGGLRTQAQIDKWHGERRIVSGVDQIAMK